MRLLTLACFVLFAVGCARKSPPAAETPAAAAPTLAIAADASARLAQFARTEIAADLSALSAEDRAVLEAVLPAARQMDAIFARQAWAGNEKLAADLAALPASPSVAAAQSLFRIHRGPWDRLDAMQPFLGDLVHPEGAGFYPEDLTKAEFEAYLVAHPEQKDALTSLTTVVVRDGQNLKAIPYREAYAQWLEPAAAALRDAAAKATNASLRKFLETRAAAFLSDDYYESDVAWMDLDAPVEVTIGPYETYEDGLFGYKAAYEAYVTVALPAESAALARNKERLPWLEKNLPIPEADKNLKRGSESPIRVVDVVFTAGDANKAVKTIAYNLPNDERVREAKGSKKVLLRNVMRAKYDAILLPIAAQVLPTADVALVSFDAFLSEVLHHELSHGLGPGLIRKDGKSTEVRLELKDLYSTLEEAKADVMGIYNILALIEAGEMPAELRAHLDPTYVAGLFRSARFGVHEAHGQGVISQFNYLLEKGALEVDAEGRFHAVSAKFPDAIRELLREMLMLQARGDYAGTEAFLQKYGQPTPALLSAIDRLGAVPVDIDPVYPQAAAR
jgi:Peptidase family M49